MLPVNNMPLGQLSREEGISYATRAKWRSGARAKGKFLPDAHATPEGGTSRDKLAAMIETASMNGQDLGGYCRQRRLHTEQIRVWRVACERANDRDEVANHRIARQTRDDKKRIKDLERALARKEKALAAAAALMILRKKADAIWGRRDREDA